MTKCKVTGKKNGTAKANRNCNSDLFESWAHQSLTIVLLLMTWHQWWENIMLVCVGLFQEIDKESLAKMA